MIGSSLPYILLFPMKLAMDILDSRLRGNDNKKMIIKQEVILNI